MHDARRPRRAERLTPQQIPAPASARTVGRMPRIPTLAAVCAVSAVLLAACGSNGGRHQAAKSPSHTRSASPAPSASPAAASPSTPAAAPLGKPVEAGAPDDPNFGSTLTAFAFKQPVATTSPKPEQAGYEWAAADVQVCTDADSDASSLVTNHPWLLVYADHTTIGASSDGYSGFPLPAYPWDERKITPGRCVRGWITFPAPVGKRPVMIEHTTDTDTTDWAVPAK